MDGQAAVAALRPRLHGWARRLLWAVTAVNALWLALVVAIHAIPLPDRALVWSTTVEYRDGQPAHVFLSPDDRWRLPVSLAEIDPRLVTALIALEDKRFWTHHGVDPIAIVRAAWTDITRMRRVSGGSTLSMQLARLLEPRPRTITSKLLDMFRAVQLDARLSKPQILEHYLARTPYGSNVEGIEAAAWAYFGHGARHLSPLEIATLLAVPQGPSRFAPGAHGGGPLRARRDAILGKLIAAGMFSTADAAAARAEARVVAPPARLRPLPRQAPHAAVWLRAQRPRTTRVRSTLDPGAQAIVERVVALHAPELARRGIYNGAVVVVDHRTRDVVALAGNLDVADRAHGGQLAMFARARSPGSTLKPLLYALAIDRGLALPDHLVADVPAEFGTFRPRNFDGDFAGLVTLREALARSLNLPFVELLARLGVEPFVAELQRSGVSPLRTQPQTLGLSLIAGGIELTPLEVAGLYATLAEDGAHRPLRLVATDPPAAPTPIYGAAAAFLTRDALTRRDRPDFPRRRDVARTPPEIHWKTGTSFGYRDAWSVGSDPTFTVAVWTGNVDNRPSHELVGSEAAGPILFDVLEGLADRSRPPAPRPPPADLVEVEVCAFSGHLPGEGCTHRVKARAPEHAVASTPCPYHQVYEVERRSGRAVLPACRAADADVERRSFVVLPSPVTAWLLEHNRAVPDAPVFSPGCAMAAAAPEIALPAEGQVVTLIPGVPEGKQVVPLLASTRGATVSWFVDGALLGTTPASQRVYWTPTAGTHTIVVTDQAGRAARRTLVVEHATAQRR